jgi:hypothetical protein
MLLSEKVAKTLRLHAPGERGCPFFSLKQFQVNSPVAGLFYGKDFWMREISKNVQ